jgi:type II secretory pathway pseudopilin PulG
MHSTCRLNRQKGFGLVELGIALVIMGAIVAGVLSMMNSTSLSQKTNQMKNDLVGLKSAINQLGYQSGSYTQADGVTVLTDAQMKNALVMSKKLPTTVRVTGNSGSYVLNHSFDGVINLESHINAFSVSLTEVPESACLELMTADLGWDYVSVGTKPSASNIHNGTNRPPLDINTASTECTGSDAKLIYFGSR